MRLIVYYLENSFGHKWIDVRRCRHQIGWRIILLKVESKRTASEVSILNESHLVEFDLPTKAHCPEGKDDANVDDKPPIRPSIAPPLRLREEVKALHEKRQMYAYSVCDGLERLLAERND